MAQDYRQPPIPRADLEDRSVRHNPFLPVYSDATSYTVRASRPDLTPAEFTGWRDEQMAWKRTCYLHGTLSPTPTFRVRGKDALRFLSETCVNSFEKFPVNTGKHGIMCNAAGQVMADGVIVRLGEDDFITYWLAPYMAYLFQQGSYDAIGEELTGKRFLFQLAGPRALEVLEAASQQDFHDLKFMRQREVRLPFADHEVSVLRMGMGGSLAYEFHGDAADARRVYAGLVEAGEPFGLRRLGFRTYMMNHTENGYPQAFYHFPYPWGEDTGFREWLADRGRPTGYPLRLAGSMGGGAQLRYRTPFELGWGKMVRFDHDFAGRAALEAEAAAPKRSMVTLVWNPEDILAIHASQYQQGEHYEPMDQPNHFPGEHAEATYYADEVMKDGELVGISSGRCYSYYYREMLSLCSIDLAHAEEGTQVTVTWGPPGSRQMPVRATVSRFPYLNEGRNQDVDVSAIPTLKGKGGQ